MKTSFDKDPVIETDQMIIDHNLKMMEEEMHNISESIGGNAGGTHIDGVNYPRAAYHGSADPSTGKIMGFSNYEHKGGFVFTFVEAVNFNLRELQNGGSKIQKIVRFINNGGFSERAEK